MPELTDNINACKKTRALAAQVVAKVLSHGELSETEFSESVAKTLYIEPNWDQGWYSPPPKGVGVLFASQQDPSRVAYDSFRKPDFWPQSRNIFTKNALGYVYVSPVNKASGIIGDFGLTIYKGNDPVIINHIKNCLDITEKTAEFAAIGMELRELNNYCQKLMAEKDLNSNRMLAINDSNKTNVGHTVPWSYEIPSEDESKIIHGTDFEKLKNLISSKRLFLNSQETFKIPPTIAFTIEPRMESATTALVSFHMIVTFKNGAKEILGNFKPTLKALQMDTIISSNYD